MPFGSVRLIPGVNVERTPTLLEAGYAASILIRFKDGLAQKLGGWLKFFAFTVSGIPRALHAWQDLNQTNHLACGTTTQLGVITSGTLTDITPQTTTDTANGNDSYTKVLLHMDGADASTTFTDDNAGGSAHTWTANGNAQIDTAQSKFGGASGLFDGTGDYITTPDSADFTLGSGDWTVDFWFIVEAVSGAISRAFGQCDNAASAASTSLIGARASGNTINGTARVGATSFTISSTTLYTDVVNPGWHHYALVRTGNTLKLFLDGVQEGGDLAISGSINNSSNNFSVGRVGELVGNEWNGWIDEFRLSVGVARWTANFTPPTAAYGGAHFSTTSGSSSVTVYDPNISNVTVFDAIYFNTPIAVGGVVLSGLYPITSIGGTTSYTITAATAATSTTVNVGSVPVFDSTSGSSTVVVTLTAHGRAVGDIVTFPIATSVGGLSILGSYTVIAVGSANAFSITATAQASSTATVSMNSGNAQLLYYINLGPPAAGVGFGVGAFGAGGFGSGITPSSQTGTAITATDWTLANWGKLLVACPKNGGIYYWDPNGGFSNAGLVSTGPIFNSGIFVSIAAQILVAYGSTVTEDIGVQQDPMLVKWSDVGNFLEWTQTSETQAREFRIPIGSMIVGGMPIALKNLIWTDLDLWAMSYVGPPNVFGFDKIGAGAGLASAHAAGQLRGNVYWMGRSNFYVLSGNGVQVIPCPVWDAVFQDLDTSNLAKIRACPNTPFNEMMWEYPSSSGGTGENDRYVKINITEPGQPWDIGPLARSAWIDQSVLGNPIAASPQSIIYQHETTNDADGQPLAWSWTSGYFYLSEGEDFTFVDEVLPDFKWGQYNGSQNAQIQMSFNVLNYPGETPVTYGPYTVTQQTSYIQPRFRCRQMSVTVSGNDLGSFSRLGKIRFRFAPDGRR